jgi:hypothetical protein
MSPERINPREPMLCFAELQDELYERLVVSGMADAVEIVLLLDTEPEPFDEEACLDAAKERLTESVGTQVSSIKAQTCAHIAATFPAGEEGPSIESPKQYIKRNRLDSRIRPELKQAQADTITSAKAQLTGAIYEDTSHEDYGPGIDDDELLESIRAYRTELTEKIISLADEIKKLMPDLDLPPEDPTLALIARAAHMSRISVQRPCDPVTHNKLFDTFYGLKNALTIYRQSPVEAAAVIQQRCEPTAIDRLTHYLGERYVEVEAKMHSRLPEAVVAAYDQAAHLGPQYRPKDTPPIPEIAPEEKHEPSTAERATAAHDIIVTELGEINHEFPWYSGESVRLELLRTNGDSLLVCSAMSDAAKAISEKVRGEPAIAKKFDEMWTRIQAIELQGHGTQHPLIKGTHSTDFHDLSIRYFANKQHNGLRTYYAKLKNGQFPSVGEAAKANGVDSETDMIILLAETDKANQLRLYHGFGISRAFARSRNVGSV